MAAASTSRRERSTRGSRPSVTGSAIVQSATAGTGSMLAGFSAHASRSLRRLNVKNTTAAAVTAIAADDGAGHVEGIGERLTRSGHQHAGSVAGHLSGDAVGGPDRLGGRLEDLGRQGHTVQVDGRPVGAVHDAAQHGDAERPAELAGGVVDGRAHARLGHGDRAHDAAGGGRGRDGHPGGEEHQDDGDDEVGRGDGQPGEQAEAQRHEHEARPS